LKPGKYTFGLEFTRESKGKYGESIGKAKLYVNDKVVAEGPMKTQPGKFTLSGDGLCIGRDSGDNVSQEYKAPGEFKGGTILGVGVNVGKQEYKELAMAAAAAFAVE
jgi:arylsulfatase